MGLNGHQHSERTKAPLVFLSLSLSLFFVNMWYDQEWHFFPYGLTLNPDACVRKSTYSHKITVCARLGWSTGRPCALLSPQSVSTDLNDISSQQRSFLVFLALHSFKLYSWRLSAGGRGELTLDTVLLEQENSYVCVLLSSLRLDPTDKVCFSRLPQGDITGATGVIRGKLPSVCSFCSAPLYRDIQSYLWLGYTCI